MGRNKGRARHHLDIYGTHLYLVTRPKAWARLRRELEFLDEETPTSAGQCQNVTWVPDGPGLAEHHVVLWINEADHANEDTTVLVDTIAHEASHAADAILSYIDEKTTGSEQRSYLTGWIAGWLWQHAGPATEQS